MLRKLLSTPNDLTLTLARVILATIFFAHGSQKMFGLFGGRGVPEPSPFSSKPWAFPRP